MLKYSSIFKNAICMKQEIIIKVEFAFFIIMALSGIVILIFCLRRNEDSRFDWEAFERTIRMKHDKQMKI